MDKVRVAIFGASGYAGEELLRIPLRHPNAEIVAITSRKNAILAGLFPISLPPFPHQIISSGFRKVSPCVQ